MKLILPIAIDINNKEPKYWEYIYQLCVKEIKRIQKLRLSEIDNDVEYIGELVCNDCGADFFRKYKTKICICTKCRKRIQKNKKI